MLVCIMKDMGYGKVVVVYFNNDYGIGFVNVFKVEFVDVFGGEII